MHNITENFGKIKKAFSLIAFSFFIIFVSGCDDENSKIKRYTEKPSSAMFDDLKTLYTEKPQEMMEFSAKDAYSLIVKNQKEFEQLKEKVKKANKMSDIISEVADDLTRIAENYQKVANLSSDISKYTANTMDDLLIGEKATGKTIRTNLNEIGRLNAELEDAKRKLDRGSSDNNEKMMLQSTIQGNASMINSLKAQNIIWEKFIEKQGRVLKSLKASSHSIEAILFVLQKNADVYSTAAQTARMSKNAHNFLGNLQALQNIDSALGDLQDSWSDLDNMVNEIAAINFD